MRFCGPLYLTTFLVLLACGKDNSGNRNTSTHNSPIIETFKKIGAKYGIPYRIMMATAFLESRLSTSPSTAVVSGKQFNPQTAETAFGLTLQELGLEHRSDANSLEGQIEAYGLFLSTKLKDYAMTANPVEPNDKFTWIWEIARIHRPESALHNIRVFFVKELIKTLNSGFHWVDYKSSKVLHFEPENPAIDIEKLDEAKEGLRLKIRRSQVKSAILDPYIRANTQESTIPLGIEVIHCPFSFSSCLRMQTLENDGRGVYLGAHYVIPQNDEISPLPVQLNWHEEPVPTMSRTGDQEQSQKVIIMLTGHAGRFAESIRIPAYPNWISAWQLQIMGELIGDICQKLDEPRGPDEPGHLPLEECMAIGEGVQFRSTPTNGSYMWGDIIDFDSMIFSAYATSPSELDEGVQFLQKEERKYSKGRPVPLELKFQIQTKNIELEKLVRCPSGKTIWALVESKDIRSQTKYTFQTQLWDSGPNLDGQQFFRAKAYGGVDGKLQGWTTTSVYITDPEKDAPTTPRACNYGQVR